MASCSLILVYLFLLITIPPDVFILYQGDFVYYPFLLVLFNLPRGLFIWGECWLGLWELQFLIQAYCTGYIMRFCVCEQLFQVVHSAVEGESYGVILYLNCVMTAQFLVLV